jgi:hypothetical protein
MLSGRTARTGRASPLKRRRILVAGLTVLATATLGLALLFLLRDPWASAWLKSHTSRSF